MKLQILVIKDAAANLFGSPYFAPSMGSGIRSFADQVNHQHENNQINLHPADFSLWHLGVFDNDTGKIYPAELRCISRATDHYTGPERPPTQYSEDVIRAEQETGQSN